MLNSSTLNYKNSIITRLIKIIPLIKQTDIDYAYDILDKSNIQQLNKYWALFQSKSYDILKKEFNVPPTNNNFPRIET